MLLKGATTEMKTEEHDFSPFALPFNCLRSRLTLLHDNHNDNAMQAIRVKKSCSLTLPGTVAYVWTYVEDW